MKNLFKLTTLLYLLATITGCLATNPYVSPPNGGAMIIPSEPMWITATAEDGKRDLEFNNNYPQLAQTEHLAVSNAGYILGFQKGEMTATYVYLLKVTKPYAQKVYTKSILENPADPQNPITYTHHLNVDEKQSQVIHGPVRNIVAGRNYILRFEVYADEDRTQLIEHIDQMITASFSNTSGCVEMSSEAKPSYMKATDPQGKPIPAEKVIFPCRKAPTEATASQNFIDQGALITEIPSHGFIGDGIAIAAGGGAGNVNFLRGTLLKLQKTGTTQRVLITSGNKALAKTVLASSVKNLPVNSLSNLQIAYLGDISFGEELTQAVEHTGAKLMAFKE